MLPVFLLSVWRRLILTHRGCPLKSKPLFVYGTLCAPELLAMLLRESDETAPDVDKILPMLQPATVKGYERRSLYFGSGYAQQPAAIASKDPNASIQGCLLTLATTSQRRKLDNFEGEGEAYKCVPVQVYIATDQSVAADMYLWNGPMEKISPDPWDFAAFVKNGLQDFFLNVSEGMEFGGEDDH
ncbi:uncharacterized protein QC761_110775 [Podospora bellae-mahoneyi]|uniref:Putative gamma-glutamylcyclotransferase n=1 Tax=Podospora bellae-mahoneyi TaxID=2093777 RepID=A0ABR0FX19_9PEZI|nr:hypothetical protein QC761_110775 [Podospora bellae-mahoneyi]